MCGIAGYLELNKANKPDHQLVARMVNSIRHRGPDEFGAFFDNYCSMGHARLSIIDLSSGSQPLTNENNNLWIVYNGEIFNYKELKIELGVQEVESPDGKLFCGYIRDLTSRHLERRRVRRAISKDKKGFFENRGDKPTAPENGKHK